MLKVLCPFCGNRLPEGVRAASAFFPFCSERCKVSDRDGLLSESFNLTNPHDKARVNSSLDHRHSILQS